MSKGCWQSWTSTGLGALFACSPAILGYSEIREATSNAIVIGTVLAATGLRAIFAPRGWEHDLASAAGLWLAVSPWVLGFESYAIATATAFATGLLAVALAQCALLDRIRLLRFRAKAGAASVRADQRASADEESGAVPSKRTPGPHRGHR